MSTFTALDKNHQNEVVNYLKFIRLQRMQTIKELHLTFKEITERRLVETTYNEDDVKDILYELERTSKCTMEDELVQHSHMNVVLISQYFEQAEKENLKLRANMPQLEDRFVVMCKQEAKKPIAENHGG
jgi:hypothetical protein